MPNPQFFINYLEQFSYIGIFVLIALSGYIVPIPEEILLLIVGYVAGIGFNNVYISLLVSILGVLAGDNLLFWLSKYKGSRLIDHLKHKVKKSEIIKYRYLMKKHIGKTIFILRFIVGLRFFSPFMAGSMKIKWKTFQFYNLLAVLIYAPIMVFLGYHFHHKLVLVITQVEIIRHIIFFLFLAIVGYLISAFVRRKFSEESGTKADSMRHK